MLNMKLSQEPLRRPLGGRVATFLGWLIYLPGPLIAGAILALAQGATLRDWRTWAIWGIALGFWGGWHVLIGKQGEKLYSIGRALAAPPASRLLNKKRNRYVLYFRSFSDDFSGEATSIAEASVEERLCQALDWIGPVVAIGKPGERLATLGAARLYVHDADWRQTALQLMTLARVVFIRMSDTPGLWWEISTTLERVPLESILIFFEKGYGSEVRERLYRSLVSPLKERGYQKLPETLGAAAFLCFQRSGEPQLLPPVEYIDPGDRESGPEWDVEATLLPLYRRLLINLPVRLGKYSRLILVVLVGGPAVFALAIDQAAKLAVSMYLDTGYTFVVLSSVNLFVVVNRGTAFGSFSTPDGGVLGLAAYIGVPLLVVSFLARRASALPAYGSVHLVLRRFAFGLLIGGAVGNVLDRIRIGGVIDFIDLHWDHIHLPLFNIADASIYISVLLSLLSAVLKQRPRVAA
jgi:signal peptidase II